MGPYSRHELFTPTASAPYNIESMFTMVNQFLIPVGGGRRPRSSATTNRSRLVSISCPGGLMSIARGEMYTDYVEDLSDSRKER